MTDQEKQTLENRAEEIKGQVETARQKSREAYHNARALGFKTSELIRRLESELADIKAALRDARVS